MQEWLKSDIEKWLKEDGWGEVSHYWTSLPKVPVSPQLKIKSDLILAGLPWFCAVFETLDSTVSLKQLHEYEGKFLKAGTVIELPSKLTWATAISGERLALNLLHRASAIATTTKKFVDQASSKGVMVLDTRKTTPGLRSLEKYAVRMGGGKNHRFSQVDAWMIKDNHKELFGLEGAIEFFKNLGQPYKNLILEIHSLDELEVARKHGVHHLMLDNFSVEMIMTACKTKQKHEFFEVSGGIRLNTINNYLIDGVDAVSCGVITQFPDAVDVSFKFRPDNI